MTSYLKIVSLNDYQKENDMSFYVDLAKKNGLSKSRQNNFMMMFLLLQGTLSSAKAEEYNKKLEEEKKAFGPEYQNVVDGLNAFGSNKVKSGEWTEQMQKDFYGMAMNTNQLRILSQLVSNQPRSIFLGLLHLQQMGYALTK